MGLRRPSAISTMRMSGGSATDSKKIVVKQPTEEEKATAQQWPTWLVPPRRTRTSQSDKSSFMPHDAHRGDDEGKDH
jgi:hypothetical protein